MDDKSQTVQSAPNDKIPGGAMPEAAEQHRQHQVAPGEPFRTAISTERDVEIVPQPGAERNVPASPEIGNVRREVGKIEVDRELVAQQARARYGHVGVSAEIAVDLHRVKEHADPRAVDVELVRSGEEFINNRRNTFRDARFFDKADEEKRQATAHIDIRPDPFR
jgi:hypothetical protein